MITDLPSSNTRQKTEKRLNAPLHSPTSSSAASNPTQNKIKPKLRKLILRTQLARIRPQFAARRQLQPLYTRSTQIILKSFETITPNNRSKRENIFHMKQLKAGGDWSYLRVDSSGLQGLPLFETMSGTTSSRLLLLLGTNSGANSSRLLESTPASASSMAGGAVLLLRRQPPRRRRRKNAGGRPVGRWGFGGGREGNGEEEEAEYLWLFAQGMGLPCGGDRPNYENRANEVP